jgi:hypothetical protein
VLDEQHALPKQINRAIVAGEFLDRFFEAGKRFSAHAEDLEELVPESLLFRSFAFDARPFLRKGDRAMADFIPRKRHR